MSTCYLKKNVYFLLHNLVGFDKRESARAKKLNPMCLGVRDGQKWSYTTIWKNIYGSTIVCKIFNNLPLF